MTTQQNLPQRNTAESHERICQESMVSKYIHDADCCREGNAFVLFSLPRELPGLFNVRFTAPADFTPGDIFTVKGQDLAVRTRLMEEPAGVLFAAGAVVCCDVDMEQGLVFITAGGEAQGGGGNAFSSAPPLMDGTATAGLATTVARSDHVHPTDTTRAPLNSPTFVGTPKAPTAPAGTATTQLATTEFVATAIEEADSAPSAAFAMVPDYANQETINRITTNNGTWTVDRDGFVNCQTNTTDNTAAFVYINEKQVGQSFDYFTDIFSVSVGDVVRISGSQARGCFFIPPKYVPVNRQYSTDEQLTGEVWIDGKPIYRKAIVGVGAAVGERFIGTVGAIDYLVRLTTIGAFTAGALKYWRPIPFSNSAGNFHIYATTAGDIYEVHDIAAWNNTPIKAIVEYTKP